MKTNVRSFWEWPFYCMWFWHILVIDGLVPGACHLFGRLLLNKWKSFRYNFGIGASFVNFIWVVLDDTLSPFQCWDLGSTLV